MSKNIIFQKAIALFSSKPKKTEFKSLVLRGRVVQRPTGSIIKIVNPQARILAIEHQRKRTEAVKALAMELPTKKEKEDEKLDTIKEAVKSLTANLPKIQDVGLDPNWDSKVLLFHIVQAAHRSSLKSNTVWIGDELGNVTLQVDAQSIKIPYRYWYLFDSVAKSLWDWSGMGKSLINEGGKSPDTKNLLWTLGKVGLKYETEQRRLKPSDYYLDKLVEKASSAELRYDKSTAKKQDVLEALALATAKDAIKLGFTRSKDRGVYLTCSDSAFGCSELSTKMLLPYFQLIIDESSVAGRLATKKDVADLLEMVTNLLTL